MQRKVKTTIAALLAATTLFANPVSVEAKYTPLTSETILTQDNSVDTTAVVTKIKKVKKGKHKGQRKVTIMCVSEGKHEGHIYSIYLSKFGWKEESFKKGEKIKALLYTCYTKKVTDDVVVNISGRRLENISHDSKGN